MNQYTDAHIHISLKHYVMLKRNVWYSKPFSDNDKPDRAEAHEYTQSDVKSLIKGNVSLAMAALYPLEDIADEFAVNQAVSKIFFGFRSRYIKIIRQRYKTKFALLNYEKDFVSSNTQNNNLSYTLVKQKSDLNKPGTKVVLTLEGGHSLQGAASPSNPQAFETEVLSNLDKVKSWEHPVFCFTLCHFQYNYLAGQAWAVPLPGVSKPLVKKSLESLRSRGAKAKITPLGYKVIQKALDPSNGQKRILIDLKHATATARKEYYEYLKSNNLIGEVPVISSHAGVSGIASFKKQIEKVKNEKANEANRKKKGKPVYPRFNPWEINMCDDDIKKFLEIGGIIGISLDQRILGGANKSFCQIIKRTLRNAGIPDNLKNWHTGLFLENIFHAVLTAKDEAAWKMICIGSDNDGIIDPIHSCPTVLHLKKFEARCQKIAYSYYQMSLKYKGKIYISSRQDLNSKLRRIFHDNLFEFISKYYPE